MRPLTAIVAAVVLCSSLGCQGLGRLDYARIYSRDGWQRPDRVVTALDIQPGDTVADLGSGDGYFVRFLSEAVGPTGTVYAVEVEEELTAALEQRIQAEGLSNVEVILGRYSDPQLPDGSVNVVFLCNTYHHIENRPDYFHELASDLAGGGRVAIVDHDADLDGVLSLLLSKGHMISEPVLISEMQSAGYRADETFDFLATQVFVTFSPAPELATER
ncbi:MAG: class I SAM-dependent methyltransferase [Myxococcota bacterium]